MRGRHLYCLVRSRGARPAPRQGIEGAPVEGVREDDLVVWSSTLPRRPRADLTRVRAHDTVVRAAMSGGTTPLPFRFGQWVTDIEALRARVREEATAFHAALDLVEGSVEFCMRLQPAAPDEALDRVVERGPAGAEHQHGAGTGTVAGTGALAGTGAAYLRDLSRQRDRQRRRVAEAAAMLDRLHAQLDGCVRRALSDETPARGSLASAAHLVPLPRIQEYRRRVCDFAREAPRFELRPTGPWPPYSFTDICEGGPDAVG